MKRFCLALALFACSASAPPTNATFDGAPLMTVPSDSGSMLVEVRTAPSPLIRGTSSLELTIKDKSGQPIDGLAVSVVPWMVSHAHGTSVVPIVSAEGSGRYLVTEVALFMPGTWQLRIDLGTDRLAPTVDVP